MLSRERLEMYRRMTPSERLALTLQASREAMPYLLYGPPEVVARRFERMRREKEASKRSMLKALAAAEKPKAPP